MLVHNMIPARTAIPIDSMVSHSRVAHNRGLRAHSCRLLVNESFSNVFGVVLKLVEKAHIQFVNTLNGRWALGRGGSQ